MDPENFCYWLQGALEVSGTKTLNEEQVAVIKEHLQLVFNKQTAKTVKSVKSEGTPPNPGGIPILDHLTLCGRDGVKLC